MFYVYIDRTASIYLYVRMCAEDSHRNKQINEEEKSDQIVNGKHVQMKKDKEKNG